MKRGKCNCEFDEVSGLTHYYISNDSINSEEETFEGNDHVIPIIIDEINDMKSKYHEFDFVCEFLPETLENIEG